MKLSDKAWTASDGYVRTGTVSEFTRGDCTVSEFFTIEAEAYERAAEQEQAIADHKQLGADEARQRAVTARRRANELRAADRKEPQP